MMARIIARGALSVVGLLLSCLLTLMGIFAATRIDFRQNTVLSILYCALPVLSLLIYLLAFVFRKLALLQVILALAFLSVYSALNWRACSELGTCTNILAVVLMTLKTPRVLAYFGVAIFSFAVFMLGNRPVSRAGAKFRRDS